MKTPARELAERVAHRLFASGTGETAARLILELPGGGKLQIGWSLQAAADEIEDVLKQSFPEYWIRHWCSEKPRKKPTRGKR